MNRLGLGIKVKKRDDVSRRKFLTLARFWSKCIDRYSKYAIREMCCYDNADGRMMVILKEDDFEFERQEYFDENRWRVRYIIRTPRHNFLVEMKEVDGKVKYWEAGQ